MFSLFVIVTIIKLTICNVFNGNSSTLTVNRNKTTFVEPGVDNDEWQGINEDLKQICMVFGVARENCTCDKFQVKDPKTLCNMLDTNNKTQVRNIYHGTFNFIHAIITMVAAVIGIIGNSLVIVIAFVNRNDLATCKSLIAQLALCDLLFAALNFFISIPKLWTTNWLYGLALCKIMSGCEDLGSCLAVGIILLITIERYIGILNPFKKGLSKTILRYLLSLNAFIAISSVIPLFIFYDMQNGICKIQWINKGRDSLIYDIFVMLFYFLIPLTIITILYLRIIFRLREKTELVTDSAIADPRIKKRRFQETKRTIYILVTVVITFAILVLPKHAVSLLFNIKGWNTTDDGPRDEISKELYFGLMYIAYFPYPFHVAVNPVIYSLIDKKWRKDLKYMIFQAERPRAFSTTFSSIQTIRRRSSPVPMFGNYFPAAPDVFTDSPKVRMELQVTPPFSTKRTQHLSDSSSKSIESEATAISDLPEPFEP